MVDPRKRYGVRLIVVVEGLPEEANNSSTVAVSGLTGAAAAMIGNALAGYARSLKRMYQPPKAPVVDADSRAAT